MAIPKTATHLRIAPLLILTAESGGAIVTAPSDIDFDGDGDGEDFLTFSNCFNGSLNPPRCP